MKLHLLALFLLVAPHLGGVVERLRDDTPAAATTATQPAANARRAAPQPQPSPAPAAPPSSNR